MNTLHGQVDELLTGYGQVDVLWFDGGWERTAEEWRSTELEALIRARQPDILINDRLPGGQPTSSPPSSSYRQPHRPGGGRRA